MQLARPGHHSRVGTEDTVNIGVDLADIRPEGCRERHGGRVGSPSAQRGDVLGVLCNTLEARHDGDGAGIQRLPDTSGGHIDNASGTVSRVGDETRLRSRVGTCLGAQIGDGHGEECHGDALTRGEQHVELASRWGGRHLLSQIKELIGRVTHG